MRLDAETLHGFSIQYLQAGFDNFAPSNDFHLDLWRWCCSDHKRVAIAAPRNHSKSTSVTLVYALGAIMFREHDFIIIVSDTEEQAKLFLGDIAKQILENDKLQAAFGINPEKPLAKESTTDIIIKFLDGHEARVMARGMNQRGRGAKWDNKRPNLILIDDAENDELVDSPDRRQKFRRLLRNSIIQSMSKTGKAIMVGTILHSDSALENYMPENQTPKLYREQHLVIEPCKISSTYTGIDRIWYGARYRSHPGIGDYSTLLWPQNYSENWYRTKYYEFLSDGDSEGYAQEYLNQPTDESRAFFRPIDMLPMYDADWGKEKTYYCGVDFAISKEADRDFSVFATVGVSEGGIMCVEDIIRARMDTYQIVETFFEINSLHKGLIFLVEKGSIWEAVKAVLFKTMALKNTFFQIVEVSPLNDKKGKASPLQQRLRAKAVRFDKDSLWWPECEAELRQFPLGRHDDQIDAIGMIPRKIDKLYEGQDYQEPEEWEIEEEYEDDSSFDFDLQLGRSSITGY